MMLPHHNDHAIWFIVFLNFFFLAISFGLTQFQIQQIKDLPVPTPAIVYITPAPTIPPINSLKSPTPTPSPIIASPTAVAKIIVPTPKVNSSITYIPITGGQTQNTDWTNIPSSQFSLNFTDYGQKAVATWDANLRVDNANGTTYVRLFDLTHSIAVNGSEISVDSTSTSTNITSGSLSFWAGNNNYIVQVKSLNGSTAFFDSGRIKIVY